MSNAYHKRGASYPVMNGSQVQAASPRLEATRSSYAAFLSYSHAADGQLAAFLQAALQRFAKPWYRRRAIRVFRDSTGLELTPDLWGAIRVALESSAFLVLLASERAAQSRWIDLEVETWLRVSSPDRILIAWTDGELAWDTVAGDFDWQLSTCLPSRLRGVFHAEPLCLDLRWAHESADLSLRRPECVDAVARISAALRHVPLDDLLGEDVRQHRFVRRLAAATVAILCLLLVCAVGAAVYALQQRDAARRGIVELMVANGTKDIDAGDLSSAALWFAEALHLEPGRGRERELQRLRLSAALRGHPAPQRIWFMKPRGTVGADFGRDSRYLVSGGTMNQVEWIDGRIHVTPISSDGPQVLDTVNGEVLSRAAPSTADERTFAVDAVSGQVRALTVGPRNVVRLRDGQSGFERVRFEHPHEVNGAFFNQDARLVVTESADNVVRIWSASDGRLLESLQHDSPLIFSALTASDRALVSATEDGVAHVWYRARDTERRTHARLKQDEAALEQIDVATGGQYAITVASRTARLWDLSSPDSPSELRNWIGVNHAEFSPNGAALLMADDFGEASIFVFDPLRLLVAVRHTAPVLHATFSADGRRFATAGADRVARIWDSSGTPLSPWLHHEQIVKYVSFDRNQARFSTTTTEGLVRLWDLARKPTALSHESVRHAEFDPDGRRLLTASYSDIKVWDLSGGPSRSWSVGSQIYHAAFSPDGRRIVSASADGEARIWDSATGAQLHSFHHDDRLNDASFRPDGAWLATAPRSRRDTGAITIWDAASGRQLFALSNEADRPDHACFSSDGRKLLTFGSGQATVWDLESRRLLHTFAIEGPLRTVPSFSPDAKLLVVVDGSTAKVFDAAHASPVGPAIQHENYRIDDVVFSADSNALLIASAGYARAWDVRRGVPLTPLLTHGSERNVNGVAASPDGRFFATMDSSHGTARVWDAHTSQPLTPVLEHGGELQEVAFSRDGALFATAGEDYARVWSLTADLSMSDEDLALHARVLAARQIDATRGVVSLDPAQFRDAWTAHQARR